MIKRIAPPIDRRFEGRALMDGAAGSALVVGAATIVLTGLALVRSQVPGGLGALLLLVVVGAIIVAACLRSPPLAVVVLLGAMFLRLALPHLIVADPFLFAYALAVASAAAWMWQQRRTLPPVTFVEVAMLLYTLWCYGSMVLPHQYPPLDIPAERDADARPSLHRGQHAHPVHDVPAGEAAVHPGIGGAVRVVVDPRLRRVLHAGEHLPVLRTESGVAAVHRATHQPGRAARMACSTSRSPTAWCSSSASSSPSCWPATVDEPTWRRALLWLYALPSTLAIYLTHTRAIYLAFALVLILGVLLAPGARGVFAGLIGAIALVIGFNWSTFTSSDRAAGGVGSKSEVWDRLNTIATSIWAFKREPWFGWGISRFLAVNPYDHQQWSNDIPWVRGLGIASHETELGILVELGIFGLLLWLCVLVPMIGLLLQAYWILPSSGLIGRRLAFVAICALATQIVSGAFADLRLLDFPTCMVFLICGMAVGARDRELAARRPRPPLWLSTPTLPDHAAPGRAATRPSTVPVEVP